MTGGGEYMNNTNFSNIIGIIFLCVGIGYYLLPKLILHQIQISTGEIVEVKTAVPAPMKNNNSKWAIIKIKVNNEKFFSHPIQVPMNNTVGDKLEVQYEKSEPNKMYLVKRGKTSILFIVMGGVVLLYDAFIK